MTVFISYALHVSEQYILNLLAKKLAERGHTLVTNINPTDRIDVQTSSQIQSAGLFIGLITKASVSYRRSWVMNEIIYAQGIGKPSILLIEEGVDVTIPERLIFNVQYFNPHNIETAMRSVQTQIDQAQQSKNNAAWLLGGIAVLALLAYLSDEQK